MTCKERYSDLEKSIYLPSPKNGGFSKLTGTYEDGFDVTKTDEFVSLHPCAQLGAKQVIYYVDYCFQIRDVIAFFYKNNAIAIVSTSTRFKPSSTYYHSFN